MLQRLVEDAGALSRIVREALERCHFDEAGNDQNADCQAACYSCLMSFANQFEAKRLDRRVIRQTLLDLLTSRTLPRINGRDWDSQLTWLRSLDQPEVAARDVVIRLALVEKGYRVIVIRYDADLVDQIAANEDTFGRRTN